ncbi:MAG: aminoglycoside phosphotransferase family protein [Armatimonadota bacterium]|nr:aminoglycoside phosphotransferase family protein [Armatimonadota bacterium]
MPDKFDSDTLKSLVSTHLPVDSSEFHFWRIPTGKFNSTYTIDGAERPLILRIAPPDDAGFVFYERNMMAQEPEIHSLILSRTSAPVPEILVYDNSRSIIDRDFLIMEKLPGRPLSDLDDVTPEFYNRVLFQVGQSLRRIHSITAGSYGYLGAHKPMKPQLDWLDAFFIMWNSMINDIVDCGCYDDQESASMRRLLDDNLPHFTRKTPAMLLHMDVWSQNILVDDQGNLTGLIDLDRALWGDPEIEFAVLDYCGISEPSFWRGYGENRDTSPDAQIRTLFYLLYEIQKYIVIRHYRSKDSDGALRYKAQVMRMASQLT